MKSKFIGVIAFGISLLLTSCGGGTENSESENPESNGDAVYSDAATSSSPCLCESSWFENGKIVPPEEGNDSPFGPLGYANTTNCLFHQWSWQKFLYLTQAESGETLPFFLTAMEQVTSEMSPVAQPNNVIVLSENVQAGGIGAMLSSNDSYWNGSDTVYYSIHISSEFRTAADSFRLAIETTPDSVNNHWAFPVGSVELKASWANANTITSGDSSDYFLTSAEINGEVVRVALLGMHVVGVVENHPEFIWATFENNNLAPHYDWNATSGSDVPVTSSENLALFQSGDQADLASITWTSGQSIPNPNNVFSIYKYGTPQVAGGGFLTGTSQNTPEENYNNIDDINKSVHDSLTVWGIDTWGNYFYDGSLWMNTDSMSPQAQIDTILARVNNFGDIRTGGPLRGSLAAANVSMETYEQSTKTTTIHDMGIDNTQSCFTCHGPFSYLQIAGRPTSTSATYISHLFMNYMHDKDPNATTAEIRSMREYLFKEFRNK